MLAHGSDTDDVKEGKLALAKVLARLSGSEDADDVRDGSLLFLARVFRNPDPSTSVGALVNKRMRMAKKVLERLGAAQDEDREDGDDSADDQVV